MFHILFVCHGNICRSAAAEMVMKQLLRDRGWADRIAVASAATTTEELGHDIYPPMKRTLLAHGIPCERHSARQTRRADADRYDLIIGMDEENMEDLRRILGSAAKEKTRLLLSFAGRPGAEIDDPWYSRDFETALRQIQQGCEGLLAWLEAQQNLRATH